MGVQTWKHNPSPQGIINEYVTPDHKVKYQFWVALSVMERVPKICVPQCFQAHAVHAA